MSLYYLGPRQRIHNYLSSGENYFKKHPTFFTNQVTKLYDDENTMLVEVKLAEGLPNKYKKKPIILIN